jgi:hypothetical protein
LACDIQREFGRKSLERMDFPQLRNIFPPGKALGVSDRWPLSRPPQGLKRAQQRPWVRDFGHLAAGLALDPNWALAYQWLKVSELQPLIKTVALGRPPVRPTARPLPRRGDSTTPISRRRGGDLGFRVGPKH